MIRRIANKNSFVGVVYDGEEEDSPVFCSTCAALGNLVKLKERIFLDAAGKRLPSPPDNDSFLQCWECGNIVAVREIQKSWNYSGY